MLHHVGERNVILLIARNNGYVGNTMGGFFCRRDKDGEERWWLEILGKSNKLRIVPTTNELMVELARYRRERGLAPFPLPAESTPLLLPIGGKPRTMTRGAVHAIVKQVFEKTARRLRERGPEFESDAARVIQASAHWLRHTAWSHMANSDVDLRHVRDNLGHESISTTNNYLHSSDDVRHRESVFTRLTNPIQKAPISRQRNARRADNRLVKVGKRRNQCPIIPVHEFGIAGA